MYPISRLNNYIVDIFFSGNTETTDDISKNDSKKS